MVSFSIYATLLAIVGTALLPVFLLPRLHVGGFVRGIVNPSRDMMYGKSAGRRAGHRIRVRQYRFQRWPGSGLAHGALLDGELTNELLYLSAAFMVASILLLLFSATGRYRGATHLPGMRCEPFIGCLACTEPMAIRSRLP